MKINFIRQITKTLKITLLALIFGALFDSCGPEKQPDINIPDPEFQSISINAYDLSDHYYSLSRKKIIKSCKINDWDLKFGAQKENFLVFLNTAKNMKVFKYTGKFSDDLSGYVNAQGTMDILNKNKVQSAIGEWGDFKFENPKSYGYTYIINLGYLNYVNEFGYIKIEFLGFSDNYYFLKYAKLNESGGDTLKIEKKASRNFIHLKFKNNKAEIVDVEPDRNDWDLHFGQYGLSEFVWQDSQIIDTSYSWTDFIWMNPYGRLINCDTNKLYDNITFWDAETYKYISLIDHIGNKYRYLDYRDSKYKLSNKTVYVIKDLKNNIYKIEFMSVDKPQQGLTNIGFRIKNL